MSKQNNANRGNYEANRNHQGEGILHEDEKRELNETNRSGREGEPNFIPGEKPVGESRNE